MKMLITSYFMLTFKSGRYRGTSPRGPSHTVLLTPRHQKNTTTTVKMLRQVSDSSIAFFGVFKCSLSDLRTIIINLGLELWGNLCSISHNMMVILVNICRTLRTQKLLFLGKMTIPVD